MPVPLSSRNCSIGAISSQKPSKESLDPQKGASSIARRLHLVAPAGQLHVHTAPYRGSFSVVLSEALRTAGLGSRVLIVQFLKGGVNQGPKGCVELCGNLQWLRPATENCLSEGCESSSKSNDVNAVKEIWQICRDRLRLGDVDQLVLDEIGLAISLGYLKEKDVIDSLEKRPENIDVTLIGPAIPSRITSIADQVTELRCGF